MAATGAVELAFCWAHRRRKFYEIAQAGNAPIATKALARIAAICAIEAEIRGQEADPRRNVRQQRTTPLVHELKIWLECQLAAVSRKSTIAENEADPIQMLMPRESARRSKACNAAYRVIGPAGIEPALAQGSNESRSTAWLSSLVMTEIEPR